jgi:hypothetical protein
MTSCHNLKTERGFKKYHAKESDVIQETQTRTSQHHTFRTILDKINKGNCGYERKCFLNCPKLTPLTHANFTTVRLSSL